jgi:hypothetical protein
MPVCSILADKRPELMLEALSVLGSTLIATESSNSRAIRAGDLATRAEPYFQHVEPIPDPFVARRRALEQRGVGQAVQDLILKQKTVDQACADADKGLDALIAQK